ncbi:Carbohydrate kinase, FGGY [Candidatus Rhodobacter oscarellae]|uniref:Carbohydrate kinase, FGGY n=1 Tax=Candidatus Rhodobacter oscarellae TaxID=1675527 RepID=A0A0J9E3M5_9RHOB|nr:FGGY family carbohydrate kinase [Candidatus Rhodobacter lobularis]KMW57395.1 Carbohydrate kinase, FGGY [Candidatus Rhodobacter lobularis]
MIKTDLIIAADFGTSGVKIGVVDGDMHLVARAVEPYPLHLPGPSQAEQLPEDWWAGFARGVGRLSAEVPDLATRCQAMVFCAQMAGLVCADANGAALRPALVWLDKRSAPLMQNVLGGWPRVSGYGLGTLARWLPVANGAPSHNGMDPIGKMLWIKQNEPRVYENSAYLLDVKDWLVHRATGAFATTADSANLTWLMDTRPGREGWSTALAKRVGLDLEKLPPIVDGGSVVGALTQAAAAQLGLRASTPVVAGGGDVTATALGSGAVDDGALHICLSTSSWVSGFFKRRVLSVSSSYATITSSLGFRPLLIATQENAGAALHWLAEGFDPRQRDAGEGLEEFYDDYGAPELDDPFFVPWLSGERVPVDDERLRGAFIGLALRHGLKEIKRSVIEGVALNTRWAFEKVAAERDARSDGTIPLVGGAAQNPHLAQALSDALNRPIAVGYARMSGVLGAASMAAPALKWYETPWEAAKVVNGREGPTYLPDPARVAMMRERYERLSTIRTGLVKLYKKGG